MTHPLSKALRELGEKLDGEGAVTLDEKADMDEAADALDARATTEAEWQDISTAPKDGTVVLAFEPYSGVVIVKYRKKWELDPEFSWVEATGEQYEVYEPTHWMPLLRKPGEPRLARPTVDRNAVLEEAAALCDGFADGRCDSVDGTVAYSYAADRIRALKEPTNV